MRNVLGRCPSTARPAFPVLVFQLSNVLRQPPQPSSEPLRTVLGQRDSPWKSFEAVALLVGFPSGNPPEISTFTGGEPYTKTVLGHLLTSTAITPEGGGNVPDEGGS